MNNKDFLTKSGKAVRLLESLIRQGHKVYVHCSAGVYRSPQIVVLYLMLIKKITSEEAVEFVKQKHPFARPNQRLINSAFETAIRCKNLT